MNSLILKIFAKLIIWHRSWDMSMITPIGRERRRFVMDAGRFAKTAHNSINQKRKYTNEPYMVHPVNVAKLVSVCSSTAEMIAAALLHDVLEDTPTTENELRELFGDETTNLVVWLTDTSRPEDGNRRVRKAIDRKRLANAPADAQTIKVADLIDNTYDIVKHDPKFAKVYMKEATDLLKVLDKADKMLLEYARKSICKQSQDLETAANTEYKDLYPQLITRIYILLLAHSIEQMDFV